MVSLSEIIQETYTKDGKELFELVQEWIDENNSFLYCKNKSKVIKCSYNFNI